MADKVKKKVGRPPKTESPEVQEVNEQSVERLDMEEKVEISVDDLGKRWQNTFTKILQQDQRNYSAGTQAGITSSIVKWNKLNPFLQNERIKNLFTQAGSFSKTALNEFLADPARHEVQLRAAGWTNSATQPIYYNMLRRASDIPLYKYFIIPEKLDKKEYKSDEFLAERKLVKYWLETLNPEVSFKTMALQIKREGKQSYLLRNRIDGKGDKRKVRFVAFEKLPSDWIKITGIGQLGYTISFDMMYFLNIANDPDDFGEFIKAAWADMITNGVITVEDDGKVRKFHSEKANGYSFTYNDNVYTSILESTGPRKKDHYLFWLRMPYDICYTFGSDNSHSWCAPDTMGALRSLQELTDYGKLAGLIASTPLTAILTGEAEFIDGARAGKNETKLSPEVISGLQDIFNATTSTNIEAMFFPLSNIKLQQLQTDVNSSEIISTATENFVETVGEGGLTITTNKPNVSQVKTAQLLAAAAQHYVTLQFENVLNFILQHKLDLKYRWKIHLWGDIFSFDGEKKNLKELVAGGAMPLLPKLLSAEGIDMLDAEAITEYVDSLGIYKYWRTFTQQYQSEQQIKQSNKQGEEGIGKKSVGRPRIDDADIDNESTSKSRDDGTNVEGNRDSYEEGVKHCPLCGAVIEDDEEICGDCLQRILDEQE